MKLNKADCNVCGKELKDGVKEVTAWTITIDCLPYHSKETENPTDGFSAHYDACSECAKDIMGDLEQLIINMEVKIQNERDNNEAG